MTVTTSTRRWCALVSAAALTGAGLVAASALPAGAAVTDETAFTDAWEAPATTFIELGSDITLTCASGEPLRNSSTTILVDGNGHTLTQTCDSKRVLEQAGSGTVNLQEITVTGGEIGGGAGLDASGDVVLTDAVFTGNHTEDEGGAIQSLGTVTLTRSTIAGNIADGSGGGIAAQGLTTLIESTVSGNSSGGNGGGVRAYGGAALVNSTVADNEAEGDGGAIDSNGDISLVYSTITHNSGNEAIDGNTLTSFASVVAQPVNGGNCSFDGTTTDGYNVDDDGSCGFGTGPGDQSAFPSSLLLGDLADNGGPTQTRLPGAGSPLLDAVPAASCRDAGAADVTTDQRGIARPQGAGCDIGSVEVEVVAPTTTTTSTTAPSSSTTSTTAPSTTTPVAVAVVVTPHFTG